MVTTGVAEGRVALTFNQPIDDLACGSIVVGAACVRVPEKGQAKLLTRPRKALASLIHRAVVSSPQRFQCTRTNLGLDVRQYVGQSEASPINSPRKSRTDR